MLQKLVARLGRKHQCRNTRLEVGTEKVDGFQGQVVITMVDKCTGATYVATYSVATAGRVAAEINDAVEKIR